MMYIFIDSDMMQNNHNKNDIDYNRNVHYYYIRVVAYFDASMYI